MYMYICIYIKWIRGRESVMPLHNSELTSV